MSLQNCNSSGYIALYENRQQIDKVHFILDPDARKTVKKETQKGLFMSMFSFSSNNILRLSHSGIQVPRMAVTRER